jgi:hypothetical protein
MSEPSISSCTCIQTQKNNKLGSLTIAFSVDITHCNILVRLCKLGGRADRQIDRLREIGAHKVMLADLFVAII